MIVYLNGKFVPAEKATVSVFDRGYLLGDGVYEGLRAFRGRIHSVDPHAARLREGLRAVGIEWDAARLGGICEELLAVNGIDDAFVYLQVTRGVPGAGQPLRTRTPAGSMSPTVMAFCATQPPIEHYDAAVPTMPAAVVPDGRWLRGRIKSVSLQGNILAAMDAARAGAREAIMVRDGLVTEACACNVLLVLPGRQGEAEIVTPSLESVPILAGVTRARVLALDPGIVERAVLVEELARASEILLVGTTAIITAVTHLDGRAIGAGVPGPQARRLLSLWTASIREELGIAAPEPALAGVAA